MPDSVWENIYKGIKDFAGDDNKANALIGGGIGAGVGGLIDGWRGAGIGAFGGGIAGYKSNDIKKWWNTPTEQLKDTPPKIEESTKQIEKAVTSPEPPKVEPPKPPTPYTAPPKYSKTDEELMKALPKTVYNPLDTYDRIAFALIKNNQTFSHLQGLSNAEKNQWLSENGLGQDHNWIFDTDASKIIENSFGTTQPLADSIFRIQDALEVEREKYINPAFKRYEEYQNNITEYNKQHPYNQIDYDADRAENLKKLKAWEVEQQQQQENLKQKQLEETPDAFKQNYQDRLNKMVTHEEFENMPERLRKSFNTAYNRNDLESYKKFEKEYEAYQNSQQNPISDFLKTILGKKP